VPTSVDDAYVRISVDVVVKVRDPETVRRIALDAVDTWKFATEDNEHVEHVEQATADAREAIRGSLIEALHAVVDPEKMVNAASDVQVESSTIDIRLCDREGHAGYPT
jgi:hypothetical protein